MNAIISISDLVVTEAEPRVLDLRLAEALGYERPRAMRQTIERNLAEIEAHGAAPRRVALVNRPQGGTVEVTEYWLNEPQALLVCMFSRTARAAEVRKQIIDVFMAWRLGERPVKAETKPTRLTTMDVREAVMSIVAEFDGTCDSRDVYRMLAHRFSLGEVRMAEESAAYDGVLLIGERRPRSGRPARVLTLPCAIGQTADSVKAFKRARSPVTLANLARQIDDLRREVGALAGSRLLLS